jgi:hypothetical protein
LGFVFVFVFVLGIFFCLFFFAGLGGTLEFKLRGFVLCKAGALLLEPHLQSNNQLSLF